MIIKIHLCQLKSGSNFILNVFLIIKTYCRICFDLYLPPTATKYYDLADIIFLTIATVIRGAKSWKAVNVFGEIQLDWLREYIDFNHQL